MEKNNRLVSELIDLCQQTEDFFCSQRQIYGNEIFLDMAVETLAMEKGDQKRKLLLDLFYEVKTCQNCPLAKTRGRFVFGGGKAESEIMLIGEAPGYQEDQQGIPFVGEAGQLLDKILAAIDLKREDIFITNILKCRPPNNRDPQPEEQTACQPILEQQLKIIAPRFILILGRIAAHALLHTDKSLTELRAKVHHVSGAQAIVTYHPAALLRNSKLKRDTWEDVQLFQKCILGK